MAGFTATQGRYLSFIHAYTVLHGYPPAESEIAAAMCVSPPSVNQMVRALERKGLISRQPGAARSILVLVPAVEIPPLRGGGTGGEDSTTRARGARARAAAPPATNLYVLEVFLTSGPTPPEFAGKQISRAIEIRGDQTLDQLHRSIFEAFDRRKERGYEFQLGRRPFDPQGPNYSRGRRGRHGDARKTTLDELGLGADRVFGYWFDFRRGWFHQVQVEKIERAIPTVSYPRLRRRVGKSPPPT